MNNFQRIIIITKNLKKKMAGKARKFPVIEWDQRICYQMMIMRDVLRAAVQSIIKHASGRT